LQACGFCRASVPIRALRKVFFSLDPRERRR
jgi:hypothetical protein